MKYERYFNIAGLKFTNLTLTVDIPIDRNWLVHELRTTVSGQLPLRQGRIGASITLSMNGTSTALLRVDARDLKVFELLTDVIGDKFSNVLQSNGFMDVTVKYVSLELLYGPGQLITASFRIGISSMENIAKVMFKNGQLGVISSKISLDKVFSSVAIKNITAIVVLRAGRLSFSVFGTLALPHLGVDAVIELISVKAGAGIGAYRLLKLQVSLQPMADRTSFSSDFCVIAKTQVTVIQRTDTVKVKSFLYPSQTARLV